MTQLPHNPQIWVEDLPEDAKDVTIYSESTLYSNGSTRKGLRLHYIYNGWLSLIALPPGTWKLICLGLQATEEEAREIVEKDGIDIAGMVFDGYCNYVDLQMVDTALQSLASLIAANGWKNPVFLRKEN